MKLTLKDKTFVDVNSVTEMSRIDQNGLRKREVIIDIADELTYQQLSDMFTSDNISSMQLKVYYSETPISYSEVGEINISLSVSSFGMSRVVRIS